MSKFSVILDNTFFGLPFPTINPEDMKKKDSNIFYSFLCNDEAKTFTLGLSLAHQNTIDCYDIYGNEKSINQDEGGWSIIVQIVKAVIKEFKVRLEYLENGEDLITRFLFECRIRWLEYSKQDQFLLYFINGKETDLSKFYLAAIREAHKMVCSICDEYRKQCGGRPMEIIHEIVGDCILVFEKKPIHTIKFKKDFLTYFVGACKNKWYEKTKRLSHSNSIIDVPLEEIESVKQARDHLAQSFDPNALIGKAFLKLDNKEQILLTPFFYEKKWKVSEIVSELSEEYPDLMTWNDSNFVQARVRALDHLREIFQEILNQEN